jgi:hypothetical protein
MQLEQRPQRSSAAASADSRWAASVTSSWTTSTRSSSPRSCRSSVRRELATTESPRASAASAMARPKPLDAPVISHTLLSLTPAT